MASTLKKICIISFFDYVIHGTKLKRHKKAYSRVKMKFSFVGANTLTHFLSILLAFERGSI